MKNLGIWQKIRLINPIVWIAIIGIQDVFFANRERSKLPITGKIQW